ncbi:MAG: hypothetical protein COS08_02140 [Euryarchaeota archaeon CG01_land_8_20_14_3_00_38_12]|nr:MAG: hypothetical protein COS08_02140 [Euryarchaeota archaeon CG01_land_8_20_14_3_00_38_12]
MDKKLSNEERKSFRNKPLFVDDTHFVRRYMFRASFDKVKKAISEGEIYQEGKKKYRAILPIKDKIMFVIFFDEGDYIEPKTVGVTTRDKGKKWG